MYYDERKEVIPEAPVILEPWQQHLLNAAQYIRDHGWCQLTSKNDKGEVCLEGAISQGVLQAQGVKKYNKQTSDLFCAADRKVRRYLQLTYPSHYWNDQNGRTKEEVIAALEGAARAV